MTDAQSSPLIRLKSVTKKFSGRGTPVTALDSVDLEVAAGDFISIIGPSGSGKSTLLLAIGGLMQPTSGTVSIGDTNVYGLSSDERAFLRQKRIGYMFQTFNLMPYLNCRDNVALPAMIAGGGYSDSKKRAEALLNRLGLGHRLNHEPRELSVGERQRVALARSLVNGPDVLLADEPTGNLDPAITQEIVKLFQELNAGGQTILMVTHDHRLAGYSKRVVELAGGRVQ